MFFGGYRDVRTPSEREAHAKKVSEEKDRVCKSINYDLLTPYEQGIYRRSWSQADAEIFYRLQLMLEERADYTCYIRCYWNGREWTLKANAADVQCRLGDMQGVLCADDIFRNGEFLKAKEEMIRSVSREIAIRGISPTSRQGMEIISRSTRIDSDMIDAILDQHKNIVFDREVFNEELEDQLRTMEDAEAVVTNMVIKAEQSEIMIIESGRLLYDINQFPDPLMRGDAKQIPEDVRELIKKDIADGNSKITVVPGKTYKYDEMIHDALWTKERLEGHVVGKDFDGKEKTFYYTFSTTVQVGRCTLMIPEPHAYEDIPFSVIPRKLKLQAVQDSFDGAIGSYLDLNKMLTGHEIADFMHQEGLPTSQESAKDELMNRGIEMSATIKNSKKRWHGR